MKTYNACEIELQIDGETLASNNEFWASIDVVNARHAIRDGRVERLMLRRGHEIAELRALRADPKHIRARYTGALTDAQRYNRGYCIRVCLEEVRECIQRIRAIDGQVTALGYTVEGETAWRRM